MEKASTYCKEMNNKESIKNKSISKLLLYEKIFLCKIEKVLSDYNKSL